MLRSAPGRLALFALLTAALALGLHLLLARSLRRIATGEIGAFNQAMQGRANADIVISGSSRAFRHYDPRILYRETGLTTFNLGRNASQIDVQFGVLKDYLRHNRKPRLVIQNLDLQSFILTRPGDIFDPSLYVPYLDHEELYDCLRQIDPGLWKWRYLPLYAFATQDTTFTWTAGLRALVHPGAAEACFDGFCPVDRGWTGDFDRFRRHHPDGIEIPIDPGGVAVLDAMADLCRREGIQLMLVYSPQYHEMIGLTRNRAKIFELFHAIAERHGLTFLDYSDSPISRSRELFYNAQHLNSTGAEQFSLDLAHRLVAQGVAAAGSAAGPARSSGQTR